jgi:Lar family restriction alleviation protein
MAELKPCPFCGGEAKNEKHNMRVDEGLTRLWYMARCQKCDAIVFSNKSEQEATDKWNRRAEDGKAD